MTNTSSPISVLLAATLLAGCAVGPDFKQPEAPKSERYTATSIDLKNSASGQAIEAGEAISSNWWIIFRSKALSTLIEQGLTNSPTIKMAEARLRRAQEDLNAQVGSVLYPSIDGQASSSRQKISGAGFGGRPNIYNVHNASVTGSYGLDLFGGSRRYLESLKAQIDFEQYQLQAARITLAANIVTAAVQEASLRSQIQATEQIIVDSEMQLEMIEKQYALGAVAQRAVLSQRTALAQARTSLPALQKQLEQNRHLLNVLAGRLPAGSELPQFTLASLQLPKTLPLSLPSELVRQRPDILAAEALLHQANANVGVATANLYPRITLTGSFGSESSQISNLFNAGTTVWGAGAGLVQPLFHGGELRAKRRAAKAAFEEAQASYQETVLQAFRNVADTLLALEMDGRTLALERDAAAAAGDAYALTDLQYKAGSASYLELLNASQQYQQATISLARAEAARFADSAALIHALGGGWWHEPAPEEISLDEPAVNESEVQKTETSEPEAHEPETKPVTTTETQE